MHLVARVFPLTRSLFSRIAKEARSSNTQCGLITMEEREHLRRSHLTLVSMSKRIACETNERTAVPLSHAENSASVFRIPRVSVMRSQISMDHRRLRGASTARHPSYYRFTGVYIFLHVLSNYIRRSLCTRLARRSRSIRISDGGRVK